MRKNKYEVPEKLWKEFNGDGKILYNEVYEQAINNQKVLVHPHQELLPQDQWEIICSNMATLAAKATMGKKMLAAGTTIITDPEPGEKTKVTKAK